jgi:hypothetical protein
LTELPAAAQHGCCHLQFTRKLLEARAMHRLILKYTRL